MLLPFFKFIIPCAEGKSKENGKICTAKSSAPWGLCRPGRDGPFPFPAVRSAIPCKIFAKHRFKIAGKLLRRMAASLGKPPADRLYKGGRNLTDEKLLGHTGGVHTTAADKLGADKAVKAGLEISQEKLVVWRGKES